MIQDKNLNRILNKYILMNDGDPEKGELFDRLRQILPSPALAADCEFIPAGHPLKQDAIILSDAFEAVTNGMFSDELLESLGEVSTDGLLAPWKPLVLSARAFYARDLREAARVLEEIPEETAPARFKPFLRALFSDTPVPEDAEDLKKVVLEDNRELKDALELIREAAGMEDLLLETAGLLIRDLMGEQKESARRIALWCLNSLQEEDTLSDRAAEWMRGLFGDREGYRLCALASTAYDPDRSLVFWLHALLSFLNEESCARLRVESYLTVIKDTAELVLREYELSDEYLRLLESLTQALKNTLFHIYPEISRRADNADNSGEIHDPIEILSALAGAARPVSPSRKKRTAPAPAVQLELFSL